MRNYIGNICFGFRFASWYFGLAACLSAASASAAIITSASGVYDEQTTQLNAVDQTATTPTSGSVVLVSLAQFKTDVSAAYASDMGGVVNFDDVTTATSNQSQIDVKYGQSQNLTLAMTGTSYQVDMSAKATIGAEPISGATYLRNGASSGIQSFVFSAPLSEVGFTVLARIGARSITATVTYDDNTTGAIGPFSVATVSGSGATSSPDTFFGFAAPTGRNIKSLSVSAGANNFFVIDDIGFVTAAPVPEPSTLALGAVALLAGFVIARRTKRRV